MRLRVREAHTGQICIVDVEPNDTIERVRILLMERKALKEWSGVLMFLDSVIEDGRTFVELNIKFYRRYTGSSKLPVVTSCAFAGLKDTLVGLEACM